jgi:hypothetical protein
VRTLLYQALIAALLATTLLGCGTTYTMVRQEQKRARFKLTSAPAGATVYVDRTPRGQTPATLEIPYVETEREVSPGRRKLGIWLLATGIAGLAAGTALLVFGANKLSGGSDDISVDSTTSGGLAMSFGSVGALYGLPSTILGIYLLASGKAIPNQIETSPGALNLGLSLPGVGMAEATLGPIHPQDKTPPFDGVKAIHFAAERGAWSAPGLPPRLQLVGKGQGGRRARSVTRRKRTTPALKPVTTTIIAVFNIEDRGANLDPAMRVRLSDYLAMKIAATGRYQVIPRDKLKERLVQQKKDSFKSCFDQSCQIEIGKELAAQKSVSTMVVKLGSKCSVTSVLYDLRTAASVGGASASGGCDEDGIVATLEEVVHKLAPR